MEWTVRLVAELLSLVALSIASLEYLLVIRRRARARRWAEAEDDSALRNLARVLLIR